jgi:predicted  nucleic acid-binding Zn-ribbon protein
VKKSLSVIGAVLVVAATSVACDKIKPPLPEVQKPPAASEQASQPEGERKVFAEAAEKELDALKTRIAEFKTKAEASSAEVKAKLGEEVQKLEADLGAAQQRLAALKAATVESWSQLKDAWNNALQKLKGGVENFRKNAA